MTTVSGDGAIDLGHGVTAEVRRIDGEIDGVEWTHSCAKGVTAPDYLPVKPAWKDGWDLVSDVPLTRSPSLLCRVCGYHGYITNGRWVPC
jgi:hypothetical protein